MMQSRANLNVATAFQMGVAFRLGVEYALRPEIASLIKAKLVQARLITNDAEFKENQHPRDKDGKFKSGNSSLNTEKELYGHEIYGENLKGQRAVNVLLKFKRGHIKDAFYKPTIGNIDLVWGNKKQGLCHAIISRSKKGQSSKEVLSMLDETIRKGVVIRRGDPREQSTFCIEYHKNGHGYRVIVTKFLSKDKNNKLHYVLTDMLITDESNKGALVKKQG